MKINRMAWQGIVSYRAEPQAVLEEIHPMLRAACFVTDRDHHQIPKGLFDRLNAEGTCDGKKQSVERAGGLWAVELVRWWWHVSSSVVCRARRLMGEVERAKLQLGQLVVSAGVWSVVWWQVVWWSTPRRNFYRPQAPASLVARPVICLEQGSAQEGGREQRRRGRARWVEPPFPSALSTTLMHSRQADRQTIVHPSLLNPPGHLVN